MMAARANSILLSSTTRSVLRLAADGVAAPFPHRFRNCRTVQKCILSVQVVHVQPVLMKMIGAMKMKITHSHQSTAGDVRPLVNHLQENAKGTFGLIVVVTHTADTRTQTATTHYH
tara:strand:+ start:422 stop:769 length:348 start_codon:yes stop_codon:yes gene_type:complete